jgi:hypothetical protein
MLPNVAVQVEMPEIVHSVMEDGVMEESVLPVGISQAALIIVRAELIVMLQPPANKYLHLHQSNVTTLISPIQMIQMEE